MGLSSGVTSQLSLFGQILIGLLMFVGRIGVLSLILSLMGSKSKALQYMKAVSYTHLPRPEPNPLMTTISKGSFTASMRVQLFSKPQPVSYTHLDWGYFLRTK